MGQQPLPKNSNRLNGKEEEEKEMGEGRQQNTTLIQEAALSSFRTRESSWKRSRFVVSTVPTRPNHNQKSIQGHSREHNSAVNESPPPSVAERELPGAPAFAMQLSKV